MSDCSISCPLVLSTFVTVAAVIVGAGMWRRRQENDSKIKSKLVDTITFVGKTIRPGQKNQRTVRFFEIFAVHLPRAAEVELIDTAAQTIALVPKEELLYDRRISDSTVAILEEFHMLKDVDWHTLRIANILGPDDFYGDWRRIKNEGEDEDKNESEAEIRISCASLARLTIGNFYALMKYKKPNADGSPRYIPFGGALKFDPESRALLESLGACQFEKGNDECDLRFRLPVRSLPAFEAWFRTRQGRECDVLRELHEEMVECGLPQTKIDKFFHV